jgi:hypothetical protein
MPERKRLTGYDLPFPVHLGCGDQHGELASLSVAIIATISVRPRGADLRKV